MIYACDACRFLFNDETEPERCPDCGKCNIRHATKNETEEFNNRPKNTEDIYAEDNE